MENVIRPHARVLKEDALVPSRNLISPKPTEFTHELIGEQPYYFDRRGKDREPDGTFPAGTKVVLLRCEDDSTCRVADSRGLYVEVEFKNLRKL